MLIEHLIKMANVLDSVGTESAIQASEGIDAVLKSILVSANDEVFKHLREAAINLTAANAKIRMLDVPAELKDTVWHLTESAFEAVNLYRSNLANSDTQEGSAESIHDVPTQEMKGDITPRDEATNPEIRPDFDPSEWDTSKEPWRSNSDIILERLLKVADLFDGEGALEAASIIDQIVKDAVELPKYPSRSDVSKELYNADKHNKDNMWDNVKQEVEKNRQQHHLLTMRDSSPTLSTRYSPELPGVHTVPVAPGVVQDYLTKKIYDYNTGFTLSDGTKIPGGNVANQTPAWSQINPGKKLFDDYEERK